MSTHKMKKKGIAMVLFLAICAFVFAASENTNASEVVVKLNGSTTVIKRVMEPSKNALEKATGIKLTLTGNGSAGGLEDLIKGRCDASMASEELAEVSSIMKAASGTEPTPDLMSHVITSDVIKVIVHPSNPVSKLTKEQLKNLNTGKITNWKEVGGKDMPVIVVTSQVGSATRKAFQRLIMDGEPYASEAIEVETTRKEIDTVNLFPEGIGAVSEGFVNLPGIKEKVKVIDTQEISRPLILVTKGTPSPNVKKILDFFKGEGKQFIKN